VLASTQRPWGYYDLGVAYEHGYGGAVQDDQIAWAYYLKAAELGSPEAHEQTALNAIEILPDSARELRYDQISDALDLIQI